MQPTEDQKKAISTRQTAIVVAGAGSGKTRVLVERYLTLLQENPDWALNNLAAITFTKAAATEMRARVRTLIEERYRQALDADEKEVYQQWSRRIAEMNSARITTIHGMCADLLRANFAEAGLDPDFQVMDEPDAAQLRADAIDLTFSRLTEAAAEEETGPNILELFEIYDLHQIRTTLLKSGIIGADLDALISHGAFDPDTLMQRWEAEWIDGSRRELERLKSEAALQSFLTDQTDFSPPANDKLTEVWFQAQECLKQSMDEIQPFVDRFEALKRSRDSINLRGGAAAAWGGKEVVAAAKDLLGVIKQHLKDCLDMLGDPPGEHDREAARLLPAWYALVRRVQETYREMKMQRAALDFDDLETLTVRLLEQHPEVVARYQGGEIRHLLIDEFQDTNQRQWRIAQHIAPPQLEGALFVVGDPKQSIYGFRGADVSVFGGVQKNIEDIRGDTIYLARSFRTHAPLVERFNAIFERVLVTDDSSPVRRYQVELGLPMDAHRQRPPEDPDTLPAIELLLLDKNIPVPGEEKSKSLTTDVMRRWEAQVIAERLKALVESGRPIYDKQSGITRPVGYGDIALLLQAMTHVTVYESVFRQMGIPYLTTSGRGYYNRQEVQDVMNLLKALYNPVDDLALASALHSPLFGLSDEALYGLRNEFDADGRRMAPRPLWDALQSPGPLFPDGERLQAQLTSERLTRWRQMAGRVTIAELLETIFEETGYLAILSGLPDNAVRRSNVLKLLDKARVSGKTTLSDFTTYIQDLTTSEIREGDAAQEVEGVTQIMTIHASKGLEFPVVVLLDSSYKGRSSEGRDTLLFQDEFICKLIGEDGKPVLPFAYRRSQNLQKQREEAERRRLLYVAATRAQDLLIISGAADTTERKADGWLGWLLEAIDMEHPLIHEVMLEYPGEDAMKRARRQAQQAAKARSEGQPPSTRPYTTTDSTTRKSPTDDLTDAVSPPLLPSIEVPIQQQVRHLAATSIADMGGWLHAEDTQEQYSARERFRRRVLYDAPAVIQRVQPHSDQTRVSARQVGDIVHQALRWWQIPFNIALDERLTLLGSYAWAIGIKEKHLVDEAAQQASTLLDRFTQSALYRWIREAQDHGLPVLRELPFVYEQESHIVHGVIDVLFQRPVASGESERWVLADYKTSRMRHWEPDSKIRQQKLHQHAARYHLQLGIYAAAAEQILSAERPCVPDVYLHYLSYNTSIHVPEATWRSALDAGLDSAVEQLTRRDEDSGSGTVR